MQDLGTLHQSPNGAGYVKITVEVRGDDATLSGVLTDSFRGRILYQSQCKGERESLQPQGMCRDQQKGRGVYGAGFSIIHLPS